MTSIVFIHQPIAKTIDEFTEKFITNNPYIDIGKCIEYMRALKNTTRRSSWDDYQTQSRESCLMYIQNSLVIGQMFYEQGISAAQIFAKISHRTESGACLERTIKKFFRLRTQQEVDLFKQKTYANRSLNKRNIKLIGAEDEIIRMYYSGMSMQQIALEFSTNRDSIKHVLEENYCVNILTQLLVKKNADIRSRTNNLNRTDEEKRNDIIKMRATRKKNNSSKHQRIKTLKTIREKYNDPTITSTSQVLSIHEKQQKYRYKDYKFNDGRCIRIQGYEHLALYELEALKYTVDDIRIRNFYRYYCFDTYTTRTYFADIVLTNTNQVIEIKSNWTIKKYASKNFSILFHMIANNIGFEFWIYDSKTKVVVRTIDELINFCGYCPLWLNEKLISNHPS